MYNRNGKDTETEQQQHEWVWECARVKESEREGIVARPSWMKKTLGYKQLSTINAGYDLAVARTLSLSPSLSPCFACLFPALPLSLNIGNVSNILCCTHFSSLSLFRTVCAAFFSVCISNTFGILFLVDLLCTRAICICLFFHRQQRWRRQQRRWWWTGKWKKKYYTFEESERGRQANKQNKQASKPSTNEPTSTHTTPEKKNRKKNESRT